MKRIARLKNIKLLVSSFRHFIIFVIVLFCVSIPSFPVLANPTGGQVAAGSAVISNPTPNTVQINQRTHKAIVNWHSFNIGAHEKTQFIQPSSKAIMLNRVNPTQGVSKIFGQLTANGKIILINQAGVYFGPSAYVNVAAIMVSTSDMTDQNFLAGNYIFDQPSLFGGSIENEGIIIARDHGLVALIGTGVSNTGYISANLGSVVLAAGNTFTISLSGDQLINFTVNDKTIQPGIDSNGKALKNGVKNSGTIIANGGKIIITAKVAKNILDNAINMDGVLQARSVAMNNGMITLSGDEGVVRVKGKIDVSATSKQNSAGVIKVLGKQVYIEQPAILTANGGGGEILIGGNAHGKGPERNANDTFIGKGVTLSANASTNGNGGKIVVWSDNNTLFYGDIFARGGSQSGNGGWIEVSGGNLTFAGNVDTFAPHGKNGSLLLDPMNVFIVNGANTTGDQDSHVIGNQILFATSDTANNTLSVGKLASLGNVNITIQAKNTITIGTALGAAAALSLPSLTTNTLTLQAGDLTTVGGGNIIFNPGSSLSTGGGAVNLIAGDPTLQKTGSATLGTIATGNGALTVTAQQGITLNNAITAGAISLAANRSGSGTNHFTMALGSSIISTNSTANAVSINVNTISGGTGTAALRNITTGNGGTLTINGFGGNITQTSGTLLRASSINLSTSTATQGMGSSLAPILTQAATVNATTGSGGIFLNNTGALSLGTVSTQGRFVVNASGAITQINPITVGNTASFSAGANPITLTNPANIFSGSIALINSGNNDVNITNSGALQLAASNIGRNLTITAGGDVTQSGIITANAGRTTIAITSFLSDIILNTQANDFGTLPLVFAGITSHIRDVAIRAVNSSATLPNFTGLSNLRNLTVYFDTGALVLNTPITTNGTGNSIILSGQEFINNIGAGALNPGSGHFLVWSVNPANDNLRLVYDFKQYNAVYGITSVLGTRNGVLYQFAPFVTPSLVGTVTKVYDSGTNATLNSSNYAAFDALDNDTVTFNNPTIGSYDTSNVGSNKNVSAQNIVIDTVTNDGAQVYGYQIATNTAQANIGSITPATLTVDLTGTVNKVYNTINAATLTAGNYVLNGVLGSDVIHLNNPINGTYNNPNVGSNIPVFVSGLAINGTQASNYQLASTVVSAPIGIITPATLTATLGGSVNKVYDTTNAATLNANNYLLSGVLGNDVVNLNNPTSGTFATANVQNNILVTVTGVGINGSSANNYQLAETSLSAFIGTITPATLTANLTGTVSKVYTTTNAAILASGNYQLNGVLGSDSVNLNKPINGLYNTPNVGNNLTVTVSGLTINGAEANNYRLLATTINAPIGIITPATLTPSLTGDVNKIYDRSTAATLTASNYVLSGVLGTDIITLNKPTNGTYNTANAGTDISVLVSGLSISGSRASNYQLAATSISAPVGIITPATLTASLTGNVNKVYDTSTSAILTSGNYILSGILGPDVVNLNNPSAGNYNTVNVGSNIPVSVTGLDLNGAQAANYQLEATSISAPIGTITPATLTASLTGTVSKVYDTSTIATLVAENYVLNGVLGNDNVNLNNPTNGLYGSPNVGVGILVTVNNLAISGASMSNYQLATTDISANIGIITPQVPVVPVIPTPPIITTPPIVLVVPPPPLVVPTTTPPIANITTYPENTDILPVINNYPSIINNTAYGTNGNIVFENTGLPNVASTTGSSSIIKNELLFSRASLPIDATVPSASLLTTARLQSLSVKQTFDWDALMRSISFDNLLFILFASTLAYYIRIVYAKKYARIPKDNTFELRTSLNTINGFASLINEEKAGAISMRQKEFMGNILLDSRNLLTQIERYESSDAKILLSKDFIFKIRTFLNDSMGFSELMYHDAAKYISLKQKEFLSYILSESNHILGLLNKFY